MRVGVRRSAARRRIASIRRAVPAVGAACALLVAGAASGGTCQENEFPLITGSTFQNGSGGTITPTGSGLYPGDSVFQVLNCPVEGEPSMRRLEVSGFSMPAILGNFGERYDLTVIDDDGEPTDTIYLLYDQSNGAISTEFPIRAAILHTQTVQEWGTFYFDMTTEDFSRPPCGIVQGAEFSGERMDADGRAELLTSTCIYSLEGDEERLLAGNPYFLRVLSFRLDGFPLPEPGGDAMLLASLGTLIALAGRSRRHGRPPSHERTTRGR